MPRPAILGLNRTQDASVCLLRGDVPWCLQKERITRRKHHWGRLGDLPLYKERMGFDGDVGLIVECYSSDLELQRLAEYHEEIRRHVGRCEIAHVSHHLAHVYSAFFPSGFDDAAVMVIDCQGSPARAFTESWDAPRGVDGDWLEVASYYACRGREVECVGKQLWDGDRRLPVGLGFFYLLLTAAIFPGGEGQEGKVMGLAPYGNPEAMGLPDLIVEEAEVHIPAEWFQVLVDRERFRYRGMEDAAQFRLSADLAAAGQWAFEEALLEVAAWLHEKTGLSRLCFAGGTALNCVANGRLLREGPFSEVFIPPAPHDGGTALGCALYGAVALRGELPRFRWSNDFLGPEPAGFEPGLAASDPDLVVEQPADLAGRAAEILEQGFAISTFNGRSESGPRALGHRSILADPRPGTMCDWINARVKGREPFRPLAPLVLLDHAADCFDADRPLPFMQFATDVRPHWRETIPAVTHVDGSARIQTVGPEDDALVHDILTAFHVRTGVPVLINTSLNGPGEPLVETAEEALDLFRRTPLHALVAPPFLVRKQAAPERPADWNP
jgi:carbamoyltransferase